MMDTADDSESHQQEEQEQEQEQEQDLNPQWHTTDGRPVTFFFDILNSMEGDTELVIDVIDDHGKQNTTNASPRATIVPSIFRCIQMETSVRADVA